jgi:hypothetical protein
LAKGARGGRPIAFDAQAYKGRNVVERGINRLKDFRAIASADTITSPAPPSLPSSFGFHGISQTDLSGFTQEFLLSCCFC